MENPLVQPNMDAVQRQLINLRSPCLCLLDAFTKSNTVRQPSNALFTTYPPSQRREQKRPYLTSFPLSRTRFALIAALLSLLALLTGCGHHHSVGSASGGNVLRVAMQTAPVTFDPAMCQDVETGQMLQQAYEGLVQYAPDNKVVPCLAEKWDISPDGLTYTFHLRPAKFQNGMLVTADDVAYSLLRALNPKLSSPVAPEYMGDIKGALDVYNGKAAALMGIKVVDPKTLAITITSPKAYWIDTLTYPTAWVECKAITQKEGTTALTDADAEAGAGTGAFRITRFVKDQEVDFDANPNYWGGAPKVSGLAMPVILNAGTRHEEFAAGKIDLMRGLQIGDLQTDKTDPPFKVANQNLAPRRGLLFCLERSRLRAFQRPACPGRVRLCDRQAEDFRSRHARRLPRRARPAAPGHSRLRPALQRPAV